MGFPQVQIATNGLRISKEPALTVKAAGGTILYFDGTHIDVTAQKQIEAALQKSELQLRLLREKY